MMCIVCEERPVRETLPGSITIYLTCAPCGRSLLLAYALNDVLDDTIGKLTADNERLRAELELAGPGTVYVARSGWDSMKTHLSELRADNERLRAERDEALHTAVDGGRCDYWRRNNVMQAQLAELREAAAAVRRANVSDSYTVAVPGDVLNRLEDVLAKVKP